MEMQMACIPCNQWSQEKAHNLMCVQTVETYKNYLCVCVYVLYIHFTFPTVQEQYQKSQVQKLEAQDVLEIKS